MKTKIISYIFIGIGAFTLMSGSCDKKEVSCDGKSPELTYEADIKPIIDKNCIGCHDGYSNYTGLSVSVNNGAIEREVLVRRTMPQGGKLEIEELIKIKCWLDNGAKEK